MHDRKRVLAALLLFLCGFFLLNSWRQEAPDDGKDYPERPLDDEADYVDVNEALDEELGWRQVGRVINKAPVTHKSTASSWKTPSYFSVLEEAFLDVGSPPGGASWRLEQVKVIDDLPIADGRPPRPFKGPILQVIYPQGSINPHSEIQGGLGFCSEPIDLSKAKKVLLKYSVFFPKDFDFVLGGKLPGLYGMRLDTEEPTGGTGAESGWSARLMWRKEGKGELYLYAPKEQAEDLLDLPPKSHENGKYGLSLGVGSFEFETGKWTNIELDILLNTAGQVNGAFKLTVNQRLALSFDQVAFRTAHDYSFNGILFETFFGGHTEKWASTKDESAYFGGFSLDIEEYLVQAT